jgi:hypothetical protein
MATTTNYSWTTPDDTDLVKDGAAAIRTLGSAIDTTVFTNAGAAIQKSIVDAAGDLIYATADDTPARLAIGTAGQVLQVNSGATAPEWAAPAASGGVTEISSTSPSGVSTVTFSSIPATYKHLFVSIKNLKAASGIDMRARINGNTSTDYVNWNMNLSANTVSGNSNTLSISSIRLGNITASATNNYRNYFGDFYIYNYAIAFNPVITGSAQSNNGTNNEMGIFRGLLDSQAAVSSLTIFDAGSNNFTGGTIYLYGVS